MCQGQSKYENMHDESVNNFGETTDTQRNFKICDTKIEKKLKKKVLPVLSSDQLGKLACKIWDESVNSFGAKISREYVPFRAQKQYKRRNKLLKLDESAKKFRLNTQFS